MTRRSKPGTAAGDLRTLAEDVRTAYILAYRQAKQQATGTECLYGVKPIPRWDGGRDADGRVHQPIWYRLAEWCLAQAVSPFDLIHKTMDAWSAAGVASDPPWPTQLMTPVALARCRDHVSGDLDLRNKLGIQEGIFAVEVDAFQVWHSVPHRRAVRGVLVNGRLNLSALYRHCAAVRAGEHDLAGRFAREALRQYAFKRESYDHAWGDFVPRPLRDRAAEFIRAVLASGGGRA